MLLKKKKRKKGTVRLCLWCSINVDTKMSGPSLTLHFLSSPPSHLSFLPPPALILSLSHPTLNILPPIYIPSRMMTKRAAERTQKKEDSLCCINAVLWKLMGGVGGGGGGISDFPILIYAEWSTVDEPEKEGGRRWALLLLQNGTITPWKKRPSS